MEYRKSLIQNVILKLSISNSLQNKKLTLDPPQTLKTQNTNNPINPEHSTTSFGTRNQHHQNTEKKGSYKEGGDGICKWLRGLDLRKRIKVRNQKFEAWLVRVFKGFR